MMEFDGKYEITHEWSRFFYTLRFKNGELRRIDEYSKSTNIFTRVFYRNPCITEFGITTAILEELVGYLCRGKKELEIKEFLEMFVNDEKYYSIIKRLLCEERRRANNIIESINEVVGE